MNNLSAVLGIVLLGMVSAAASGQGRDVPVPPSCTPALNAKLQQMIRDHPHGYIENVMVCGVALGTRQ